MRQIGTPERHARTPASGSLRARLGCEALEARENPSGNMAAFFSAGGVLNVFGDASDNAVSIQQNGLGDTIIYGVNGTTINGLSAIYVGRGALGGLHVEGGFGNDLVEVMGMQTPGDIVIGTGAGNDGIHVNGVVVRALGIDAGIGNDTVTVGNVYLSSFAWISGGGPGDYDIFVNQGIYRPYWAPVWVVNFESLR
jgi:hypothetical protein